MNKGSNAIYTDIYPIVKDSDYFLYIFIGGRGIGKTYSMLKGAYYDNKKIIYLRRTQTMLENCCTELDNPYKSINRNEYSNIHIQEQKDIAKIVNIEGTDVIEETIIGYGLGLNTFGKFRGADFSDVDYIVFDEFINLSGRTDFKNDSYLLFNLIETVNRNRELEGKPSIKIICISNAESIDNDLLRVLKLPEEIQKLKEKQNYIDDTATYTDDERGIYLSILKASETFIDLKLKTKLAKLTEGTSFYEMAYNNEFTKDYFGDVSKIDFRELKPLVCYNNLYMYEHKSKGFMYVCKRRCDCEHYDDRTFKAFKRRYGLTMLYYIEHGYTIYSDYSTKLDTLHIFDKR